MTPRIEGFYLSGKIYMEADIWEDGTLLISLDGGQDNSCCKSFTKEEALKLQDFLNKYL